MIEQQNAIIAADALMRGIALSVAGLREQYDTAEALADTDPLARETRDKLAAQVGYPLDAKPRTIGGGSPSGFVFTRVGDRLASGLKPIAWLVRNYVEADSLALLFGDPNCGKSFVAIDVACCIATGAPWWGNKTKQGAVFYIAGEGQNGLDRRFAAWAQGNDIDLADAPLFSASRPAMLVSAAGAAEVANAVQALVDETGQNPALIVVDTLARNFGGDENSQEDMAAFIANLDVFLRKSGEWGATVLIVHHSGHADKSRGRGSSALKGALDAEYSLTKGEDKVIRFEATKMKDAGFPDPLAFRMEVVELDGELDDEGDPVTSVVLRGTEHVPPVKGGKAGRGKNQIAALAVLKGLAEASRDGEVADADWRRAMEAKGIGRTRFYEIRQSLIDAGAVFTGNPGHVRVEDDGSPL